MRQSQKVLLAALTTLFFGVVFVFLLAAAMQKPLDHDEHQFIASGALLARDGLVPYVDYAYFHMPNQVFVFAALFSITDYYLLVARLFMVVCSWLGLGVILYLAFGLFRQLHPIVRFLIAAGCVVMMMTNPLFAYASGKAWNHDLSILLALLAVASLNHGARQTKRQKWVFVCGLFLGLAVGTRLSFAPAVLPFLIMALMLPERSGQQRWRTVTALGLGLLLGLLPSLVLFFVAPEQFLFGNLTYAKYNTIYRQEMGFVEGDPSWMAMTFGGKLEYVARYVISSPANLLLLLSFVFFALTMNLGALKKKDPYRYEFILVLLLIPFLLLGAFAPTPSFFQYFYALAPFLLLGALYGIANLQGQGAKQKWCLVLLGHMLVLSSLYGLHSYRNTQALLTPEDWLPVQTHSLGTEIGTAVGEGTVLTLAPIFPLEGGVKIFSEFATGSFAWRIAPYVPNEDRQTLGLVSESELNALLEANPPDGILVGYYGEGLEQHFINYAAEHGYQEMGLSNGKSLWLPAP